MNIIVYSSNYHLFYLIIMFNIRNIYTYKFDTPTDSTLYKQKDQNFTKFLHSHFVLQKTKSWASHNHPLNENQKLSKSSLFKHFFKFSPHSNLVYTNFEKALETNLLTKREAKLLGYTPQFRWNPSYRNLALILVLVYYYPSYTVEYT